MAYTPGDQASFIAEFMPWAKQAAGASGGLLSPADALSQWGLETGWGKAIPASYNYAGIKTTSGSWQSYQSMDEFVTTYMNTIKNDILNRTGSTFIDKVKAGNYEGNDPFANATYGAQLQLIQNNAGFKSALAAAGGSSATTNPPAGAVPTTNTDTSPTGIVGSITGIGTSIKQAMTGYALMLAGAIAAIAGLWLLTKTEGEKEED